MDSLSAAGAISYMCAIGVIRVLPQGNNNRFDIIPLDIVTNQIIVGIPYTNTRNDEMVVMHSASSDNNP